MNDDSVFEAREAIRRRVDKPPTHKWTTEARQVKTCTMTDAPPPRPLRTPPSIGGTGLAMVAGLLIGRNAVEVLGFGQALPIGAWLVPGVMLAFVGVLLQAVIWVRHRMGVQVDPSSLRRQWWVVAAALTIGTVASAAIRWGQGANP